MKKNYRDRVIKNLRRKAEEFGFTLQPDSESVS